MYFFLPSKVVTHHLRCFSSHGVPVSWLLSLDDCICATAGTYEAPPAAIVENISANTEYNENIYYSLQYICLHMCIFD